MWGVNHKYEHHESIVPPEQEIQSHAKVYVDDELISKRHEVKAETFLQ